MPTWPVSDLAPLSKKRGWQRLTVLCVLIHLVLALGLLSMLGRAEALPLTNHSPPRGCSGDSGDRGL